MLGFIPEPETRNEPIFPVSLFFKNEKLTVIRIPDPLKFFNAPVKPSHQEDTDGHPVCHNYCIFRIVFFFEIAVKCIKEITYPVIYICAGFSFREPVIESAVSISFTFEEVCLFLRSAVTPFLFTEPRIFPVAAFFFRKMPGDLLRR